MKICESPNPFGKLPIDRIFAFCSSVLSPEGKEQIGGEKEQSAYHQATTQSSATSPNNLTQKDAKGLNEESDENIEWRENGQSADRRRGRQSRLDPPFCSIEVQVRACKTWRTYEAVRRIAVQADDLDVDRRLDEILNEFTIKSMYLMI
uniref:Uncharacterized protein n=1 Tax=Solanum tuberosum TaxID=4113 RepID=M1DBX7_SOLTU